MLKLTSLVLIVLLACAPFTAQTKSSKRPMVAKVETAVAKPTKTLPLKRLVLYSNGVAYFERRGTVTDNAEVELPFKQSQVDDVLKSMVVLDLGKGKIGAVSYNSSAPPSARLDEIPFSIESGTEDSSDNASHGLAGVLSQLQGARVAVNTGIREAIGSILTIERRKIKDDPKEPERSVEQLVIASDSGELSSFDLSEVKSVRLLDDVAKHDIKEFTDASASARRRDAKTIVISSDGTGPREMVVSYILAAPIWKTSYRVVLDDSGKPFFQGWAIVDNVSDEDWRDVSLSLVSGQPVSFIQPIQQPLYRYRPVVPIPDDLNLDPQVYEPAVSRSGKGYGSGSGGGVGAGSGSGFSAGSSRVIAPPPPPAPKPGEPITTTSDIVSGEESGIETAATGNELGALFEYKVDRPITVQRNRSALIPI
ncbi:MAG TPA: hypothetical protein VFC63_21575, partial [Blastocatellia bacterium]|nr:hypothetical protein [Blastocatellia bacterium]